MTEPSGDFELEDSLETAVALAGQLDNQLINGVGQVSKVMVDLALLHATIAVAQRLDHVADLLENQAGDADPFGIPAGDDR